MAKLSYNRIASTNHAGPRPACWKARLQETQAVLMHLAPEPAEAILQKPTRRRRHLCFSGQGGCQKTTALIQI